MSFEATLDRLPFLAVQENWQNINNAAFRDMADRVVEVAKGNITPTRSGLHNRSSKLRDSIRVINYVQFSPSGEGKATIGAGSPSVPYAAIHEYGGIIRAKNSTGYLTFQVNGRWVRKRSVTIPARPYLQPAALEVVPEYDVFLQQALDRILGNI